MIQITDKISNRVKKKIFLLGLLVIFGLFSGGAMVFSNSPWHPHPAPAHINIGVCVHPPFPDVSDPRRPIFRWTTSGNPQIQYRILIDNSPPVYIPAIYEYRYTTLRRGHLWPRCNCDINSRIRDCPTTFSATVGDPAVCYDRFVVGWWWTFSRSAQYNKHMVSPEKVRLPSPIIDTGAISSANRFHQLHTDQLVRNRTYYWCVAVRDAHGWTGWTGCRSFFLPGLPPSANTLNATLIDGCPNLRYRFSWNFIDIDLPNDHQSAFRVQVDDDPNFGSPIDSGKMSGSLNNAYLTGFSFDTHYYWRVMVWDSIGLNSGWINGTPFDTPCLPPSADTDTLNATLIDGCRGLFYTFSWNFTDPDPNDRQSAYRVQVDDDPNFGSPIDSEKRTSPSEAFRNLTALTYNTRYHWRVKVWDSIGLNSGWVNGPSFKTPLHRYPEPDFTWLPNEPITGERIELIDDSICYEIGNIPVDCDAWSWEIYNHDIYIQTLTGSTVNILAFEGLQVKLTVTDASGFSCCSEKKSIAVIPEPPIWIEAPPIIWLREFWANVVDIVNVSQGRIVDFVNNLRG